MTNIVLIHKSGGDFKMSDAYLLVTHINKYWQGGDKPAIYCYSDSVNREVKVVGLTIRPLPNPEWKGWWSKMNLFHTELESLRPFMYLDLDTAVLKSVHSFVPPEDKKEMFVALRDFYRPNEMASGFMWIPNVKKINDLFKVWTKGVDKHIKRFRGDQNFIDAIIPTDLYWQDISSPDYVTTFKPNRVWRTEMPKESAIVCFHGKPRIPEAAKTIEWVKSYVSYEI